MVFLEAQMNISNAFFCFVLKLKVAKVKCHLFTFVANVVLNVNVVF